MPGFLGEAPKIGGGVVPDRYNSDMPCGPLILSCGSNIVKLPNFDTGFARIGANNVGHFAWSTSPCQVIRIKTQVPIDSFLELARVEDFSSNSYDRHYSDDVLSNHSAFYNVTVNQVFYSRNTINQINQILFKWCCFTL